MPQCGDGGGLKPSICSTGSSKRTQIRRGNGKCGFRRASCAGLKAEAGPRPPRRARKTTNRAMRPSPPSTTRSNGFARLPVGATTRLWPTTFDSDWPKRLPIGPIWSRRRPPAAGPANPRRFDLLDNAPAESELVGFWHLLKADLLRRLGKPTEAEREIAAAVTSTPAPPAREVIEVKVPLLIELKRYDDAAKSLAPLPLEKPVKALWMVRICLARLGGLSAGGARFPIESELFGWIKELRPSRALERRRHCWIWPAAHLCPTRTNRRTFGSRWRTLMRIAGEPAKAGAAMVRAAERAAALGQPAAAAAFRLRGGGFLFQAADYLEADKILSRAVADPAAGALRAKAGMLRCLARGRAVAMGLPGASRDTYATALQEQLRDFPADPATNEARWLSGQLAIAAGDRTRAEALWAAIAIDSPRWLDSRLAIAALDRDDLDRQYINPDAPQAGGPLCAGRPLSGFGDQTGETR